MSEATEQEYYIGVMSGTSLDGVDVALVAISALQCQLIRSYTYPMPEAIKHKVLSVCNGQPTSLNFIGELDNQLGHLFADAVLALLNDKDCPIRPEQIRAIGNHGQTVFHQPDGEHPFTLQLGDANIIAARTHIDTIADFRRKDMAYGGQGAPLVPAFHQTLFDHLDSTIVVLNIGGIANISVLNPGMPVLGYDTGPGNVLLDGWCLRHCQQAYDKEARFALQGKTVSTLLDQFNRDPYFSRPAPKSTGREYFNLDWLDQQLQQYPHSLSPEDIQRTLTELTTTCIIDQIKQHRQGNRPQLLVCGGGANNPLIMHQLTVNLSDWQVATTDQYGIDGDFMEAIAFAWLAQRRIHNLPSNLPQVTGASRSVSLGVIYPADL